MSDDLEGTAYKSRLYEGPRVPPPESEPGPPGRSPERLSLAERFALAGDRLMRRMLTVVGILVLAVGLIWLLSLLLDPGDRTGAPEEALVTPRGGLLADLRGDDVIHRLQSTQAALKREMAMIREAAATRGGVPLPYEAETTYVLGAHAAELEQLGSLVKWLEADQRRLRAMAKGSQAGVKVLDERLKVLEQRLEAQPAVERN